MSAIKLPVRAVQEMARIAPQVWFVMDADGNKVALSNKESVDAIVSAMNSTRILALEEAVTFYAKRHHDANHMSDRIEDCTSEVCTTYSRLMTGVPTSTMNEDAKFMANVWSQIRQHGYEFITEGGDPEGVDFVADRILGIQS